MARQTNAFLLLGIEPEFKIDAGQLDQQYFHHLALVHPDKYLGHPKQEQDEMGRKAAMVTEAYETLKSKYTRAQELLAFHGIKFEGKLEQDFLLETMEWRESLMEVSKQDQALELIKQMNKLLESYWQQIEAAFSSDSFEDVAQALLKIKFIERFINEIKDKEAEL